MAGNSVRQLIVVVALAVCASALPGAASAQDRRIALVGTVKDAQGAVIAGATVRVASTALIGGPAATKTNEKGQLRFAGLPIGDYALTVEAAGFASYRGAPDIPRRRGRHRWNAMSCSSSPAWPTPSSSGSRIEARDSGIGARFGRDDMNSFPTRRFSMVDPIRAAPQGVSPTSPASGSINSFRSSGQY